MIWRGWREQYDRMIRSHARFKASALGINTKPSAEAVDDLIHFFQDSWHLTDWLTADPAIQPAITKLELLGPKTKTADAKSENLSLFGRHRALEIGRDIANGAKHFAVTQKATTPATLVSQSVTVFPHAAGADSPDPVRAIHRWTIDDPESQSHDIDALYLANEIVTAWNDYLHNRGLLS